MAHLIVVEGYDGAGKSTLIEGLRTDLVSKGLDITVVKAFQNEWVPERVMADIVMGLLTDHIAAQLRLHRYLMQTQSVIAPFIDGGVNVLSDRGPASAIWHLSTLGRDDLIPLVQAEFQRVSMHLVVECKADTCFNRISQTRLPSRTETNFAVHTDIGKKQDAFATAHSNYYQVVRRELEEQPHQWIDGETSPEQMLAQSLSVIEPILSDADHLTNAPTYDGLAAEVREARSFRFKRLADLNSEEVRSIIDDGTELTRREWLQGISEDEICRFKHNVIELTRCRQAHVRETAIKILNKFGIVLQEKEILEGLKDADKDVRKEASVMAVNLPLNIIENIINSLAAKPGGELESLIETMMTHSCTAQHQSKIMSLIEQFPYLRQAVARGCRRKNELDKKLIATLLAEDKARITFLSNLDGNILNFPRFGLLRKACREEVKDELTATRIALQATAAAQNSNDLLDYGSLLYSADHQVAKAAVEAWIGCGLGAWIPTRFEQNPDFTIRRRLAMALHPNRSGDHAKASPIDKLFFSTRPGRHLDHEVSVRYIREFTESLAKQGFTQILVLTTEQEDISHYGECLVKLYRQTVSQSIKVKRFPIPPQSVPLDNNNAPDHLGLAQVIAWLDINGEGYKLVHCGGGKGRSGLVMGSILREKGWPFTHTLRAVHRAGHVRDDAQSDFVKNHG